MQVDSDGQPHAQNVMERMPNCTPQLVKPQMSDRRHEGRDELHGMMPARRELHLPGAHLCHKHRQHDGHDELQRPCCLHDHDGGRQRHARGAAHVRRRAHYAVGGQADRQLAAARPAGTEDEG